MKALLEKAKKKKKNSFEVIVDVSTALGAEELKKFIGRVIGYAGARGHKMDIVQVAKKD